MNGSRATSVLAVCIDYKSMEETATFVHSLLAQQVKGYELQLLVVDNGACLVGTDSTMMLGDVDPRVHLLTPPVNLGYFGGAAWAMERYLSAHRMPDWLIVANPDIRIEEPDFLVKLITLYPASAPAVIAPSVISTVSTTDQNPFFRNRPSATRMHFYKHVFHHYPSASCYTVGSAAKRAVRHHLHRIGRSGVMGAPRRGEHPERIYAPHGSFMVFNRRYFDSGGSLRHGAFLFGEEFLVAESARVLGLEVVYDPRLAVEHREHVTTGVWRNRQVAAYLRDSSAYVANEFFCDSE